MVGDKLCLNFINTVDWRGRKSSQEFLNTYRDLIKWSKYVGLITYKNRKILSQRADEYPSEATNVLSRALELRETLYRIFSARVKGKVPIKRDLTAFNQYFSRTMRLSKIVSLKDGFYWDANGKKEELDCMLNPIVHSAADLLVSNELNRVKKCKDVSCGWLYFDTSRNRSRRWCDMKDCGNRAKARRFYKKKKNQTGNITKIKKLKTS